VYTVIHSVIQLGMSAMSTGLVEINGKRKRAPFRAPLSRVVEKERLQPDSQVFYLLVHRLLRKQHLNKPRAIPKDTGRKAHDTIAMFENDAVSVLCAVSVF